jgi:hypothetical protein
LAARERLLDAPERLLDPLERLFEGLRAEACLALDARVFEPAPLLELDAGREVERFDVRDFVWAIVVPLLLSLHVRVPGACGRDASGSAGAAG